MYTRTKYACFITSFSTAITANLTPILFITFKDMFGLSYSLLGLLVVINFGAQLLIDLIFSFFSHRFNLALSMKLTPAFMVVGLILFGCTPFLFPRHIYVGMTIATILFSVAGGLAEVLTSPTIASLPSKNPERMLSRLHSCYAWGVVAVVLIATVILYFVGTNNWQYLYFGFSLLPLTAFLLFIGAPIPVMKTSEKTTQATGLFKNKELILFIICIFLGGSAECAISQWCSGYLEEAFSIPKLWGDIFGVALFGVMLGLGRTLYAKFGKNVENILFFGSIGATVCYLIAVFSPSPVLALLSCALTGLCVSMLWPGSLIVVADRIPEGGVTVYAMMAAGGDLGAGIGPQLIGIVADAVLASSFAPSLCEKFSLSLNEFAMKAGLGVATLFPLFAIVTFGLVKKIYKKKKIN